jgi:hypothetical protein
MLLFPSHTIPKSSLPFSQCDKLIIVTIRLAVSVVTGRIYCLALPSPPSTLLMKSLRVKIIVLALVQLVEDDAEIRSLTPNLSC